MSLQRTRQPMWRPQSGLTLAEVMVTVAIVAVVTAVAVPSFSNLIHSNRLSSYTGSFVASTQLARGEAIKSNATVTLCRSSNGTGCATTGGWQPGWIVFRDTNGNGTVDTGETVIQVQQALSSDYRMSSTANALVFQPSGVGSTSATLTLCKATPSVNTDQRQITLSVTGRATVTNSTAGGCT